MANWTARPGELVTTKALAVDGTPYSTSSTTVTEIYSYTIPGGTISINGALRISTLWQFTGNANSKTIYVYFGGMQVFASTIAAAQKSSRRDFIIWNQGSATSQVSYDITSEDGMGITTTDVVQGAENTNNSVVVSVRAQQNAVGDDIEILRGIIIEAINP